MIKKVIIILIGIVLLIPAAYSGISNFKESTNNMKERKSNLDSLTYPYKASNEVINRIKENCNKIKRGMSDEEVIKLLGKPLDIRLTYSSKMSGEIIGKSFFYLLGQQQLNGSHKTKKQVGIRIRFNLKSKLRDAYGIRTPFFKDIEKEQP